MSNRRRLLRDSRGLTTVEYIIVLCLIAVAGFAMWQSFGDMIGGKAQEVDAFLDQNLHTGGSSTSSESESPTSGKTTPKSPGPKNPLGG